MYLAGYDCGLAWAQVTAKRDQYYPVYRGCRPQIPSGQMKKKANKSSLRITNRHSYQGVTAISPSSITFGKDISWMTQLVPSSRFEISHLPCETSKYPVCLFNLRQTLSNTSIRLHLPSRKVAVAHADIGMFKCLILHLCHRTCWWKTLYLEEMTQYHPPFPTFIVAANNSDKVSGKRLVSSCNSQVQLGGRNCDPWVR